ncbi:MAG TPA: Hpt domain-containing protein, partial [Vicinamibacteria bacterium]
MDFQVSAELIAIYLEDARGHLASLDQGLLRLEREGLSAEVVGSLLGPLHTLKGNSGMMGFGSIKDYLHRLEDVLGKIRDGSVTLGPGAFDRLFAGVSALRDAVERACQEGHEARDLGPERGELEGLLSGRPREKGTAPAAALAPPPPASVALPVTAPPSAPAAAPGSSKPGEAASVRSNMVRVDFGRLDHLLNLVGELIV